jgi:hypothetical protein
MGASRPARPCTDARHRACRHAADHEPERIRLIEFVWVTPVGRQAVLFPERLRTH